MSTFGPEDFDDYDYYDELDEDFDDLGAGLLLDEDDEDYGRQRRRQKDSDKGFCTGGCCSFIFVPIIVIAGVIALIKSCVGG